MIHSMNAKDTQTKSEQMSLERLCDLPSVKGEDGEGEVAVDAWPTTTSPVDGWLTTTSPVDVWLTTTSPVETDIQAVLLEAGLALVQSRLEEQQPLASSRPTGEQLETRPKDEPTSYRVGHANFQTKLAS